MARISVLLGAILFFAGCASIYPQSLPYPEKPRQGRQCFASTFSYTKARIFATIIPDWSLNNNIAKYAVSFPLLNEAGNLEAEYFKQKSPGKKKLIIVLPIIDSTAFVGEHYAHIMTSWNGSTDFNVLLVKETKKIFPLDEMQKSVTDAEFLRQIAISTTNIKNYIINVKRLIDWAQDLEEIDHTRVGIIGGSIAASYASLVMATDNRITVGVFDKGGGNLHQVFADSEEPNVKKTRGIILKRFNWSKEKFEEMLEPILSEVNPTLCARYIDPSNILFIIAKNDEWLGSRSVESFWRALREPWRIDYSTSHRMAFLLSLTVFGGHYVDSKIFNHFKNKMR